MKTFKKPIILIVITVLLCGYTFSYQYEEDDKNQFDIEDLYDYQREYKSEQLSVCSTNTAKTYMDYCMTTVVSSRQYQFIHNECEIDKRTGFLLDSDGFIAVALGSYYGEIGDRFYFVLDSGIVLPLVKAEEKADEDTDALGCYHTIDGSVIEFVIDEDYAKNYFWSNDNGLVLNGNYNNYPIFNGSVVRVEKVLNEKRDDVVIYKNESDNPQKYDMFYYASGY